MKAAGAGREATQAAARVEFTVEFSRGPKGKRQLRAGATRGTAATETRPAATPPPTPERTKLPAAPREPKAGHRPRQAHTPVPERVTPVPLPTAPPARPQATPATPVLCVPKITQLLVLGHHFERLVREGVVRDYAEIARRTGLTRARVTQICNLTLLAPGIQEEVLAGATAVIMAERGLRQIVAYRDWISQRGLWRRLGQRACVPPQAFDR